MKHKLLLSLSLCVVTSAFALNVPDKPIGRVHDEASLLASQEKSTLESKLAQFEEETSNQIVVATFPSLEGDSLEDFSIRLAEKWKIGQKDKNNGIILLIFPNDRRLRIEVGYGLEGAVPDAYASRIIEEKLKPAFRAGQFYQGIDESVDALMAATRGIYEPEATPSNSGDNAWIVFLVPGLIFALFLFVIIMRVRHPELFVGGSTYSHSGRSSGWSSSSGSGWSSGGGGFSGGGGSFGGGGSSGSW